MKICKRSLLTLMLSGLLGASQAQADRQLVNTLSRLGVNYQVVDNQAGAHGVACDRLGADWGVCSKALITLTNNGPVITDKNWTIWYHSNRRVLAVENDQFAITHVNGDLYKLTPTEKFSGFPANGNVEIPLINEYWQLFESDFMPRWYVTSDNAMPRLIAATNSEDPLKYATPLTGDQWKRTPDDHNILMTPATRFDKNSDTPLLPAAALRGQILPTPLEAKIHPQDVDLSEGVTLDLAPFDYAETRVITDRFARLGIRNTPEGYAIHTRIESGQFSGKLAMAGAYTLSVTPQGAQIVGYDKRGVFYGLQSLLSLIPAQGKPVIAALDVKDAPRFAYRGLFIDVARNFHSKAALLRVIDQMAAYKLNKLHLHLTDDEGWRIAIPGLPELTSVGAKRCHDLDEQRCLLPQLGSGPNTSTNGSGYYTRQDYIDILRYAANRQIDVIPEIDMPAHARAAVIAMEARYRKLLKEGKEKEANEYRLRDPQDTSNTLSVQYFDRSTYLNPCLNSTWNFVRKVVSEMQNVHKEAGQPLTVWHFGGDEAKNILLGDGYTDRRNPQAGKGQIDRSQQDIPWSKSPQCQKLIAAGSVPDDAHLGLYFARQVSKIVHDQGIAELQAWQDGLKGIDKPSELATARTTVNVWDTLYWGGADTAAQWAAKGFDVVISSPDYLYLDMPAEVNPHESGYYWATRFSDTRKMFSFAPDNLPQNAETSRDRDGNPFTIKSAAAWSGVKGISAHLWSEVVRTDKAMEAKIFPRLLAVAERGWHKAGWEQNWQPGVEYQGGKTHHVDSKALLADWVRFANLLGQRELSKLEKSGVAWRIPQPGARIRQGVLEANIALPGVRIEYSLDGGNQWQVYDDKARPPVSGDVLIRARTAQGDRYSRVEKVTAP